MHKDEEPSDGVYIMRKHILLGPSKLRCGDNVTETPNALSHGFMETVLYLRLAQLCHLELMAFSVVTNSP